ncbi:MAG: hypothetical protein JO296_08235 [Pseudonocardiales bacterium]|nr:hypothetical protein [Pseudonocardiales bacterium]MBV9650112.1 hypothetical protein [Pseudonocardiales bacterium]
MSGSPEDPRQRLARNLNDLLQELRVALAGVQILFGFLLSIVFTVPYQHTTALQRGAHLIAVLFSVIAVALMTAPAAWHRLLFRQGERPEIVRVSNTFAIGGLVCLALAMSATVFLLADVVLGNWSATVACALSMAWFGMLWFGLPLRHRLTAAERNSIGSVR